MASPRFLQSDFFQLWKEADLATSTRCLYRNKYGERCKREAIKAHSLQRKGPLREIEHENHVYSNTPDSPMSDRLISPIRVSTKRASTFPGFCSEHDASLFKSIETSNAEFSAKAAFVVSFRAFCMELYKKEHQKNLFLLMREDKRLSSNMHSQLKSWLKGITLAQSDTKRIERSFYNHLHGGAAQKWQGLSLELDQKPPFCYTGGFAPDIDLCGHELFLRDPVTCQWNMLTIFCGRLLDKNLFVVAGFQHFSYHRTHQFLESLLQADIHELPNLILNIGIIYVENFFMNIPWFDSLPPADKLLITQLRYKNVVDSPKLNDFRKNFSIPLPGVLSGSFCSHSNPKA